MIEYYKLYLPKSRREVKIEVSVPRQKENIIFDSVYFLDGQNAFKDSHAAFGRSIRAAKTLGLAAKEMGKRILGVAVYNSESDLGRINEYSPFLIQNPAEDVWKKQDIRQAEYYAYDFVHTIIPFIEGKYRTYESEDHRAIYGSSLGAIAATYISYKYKNSFKYIGSFSTPSFLYPKDYLDFIEKHLDKEREVFLYVGKEETSDGSYDRSLYMKSAMEMHDFLKKHYVRTRLAIDPTGVHNEETWGKHIKEFINFIYFDDIYYTN